jgi:hypothetical protein
MSADNNIQEELNSMGSPLAGLPGKMPYAAPAGYFEQLAGKMAQLAQEQENATPDFGRSLPYEVPAGYFESLPAQVLQKARNEPGKVAGERIAFFPGRKWAAAAALAVIIGSGAFIMFSGNNGTGAENILAAVPQHEIKEYVQHSYGLDPNKVAASTRINNLNVDSKDIVAYLNETGWD